ncbi:uncharacterized protein PAE49_019441 [Odontesthes bonariensis]
MTPPHPIALGGAGQVSWEPGAESGLLLLPHLFLICPHRDTLLGAAGATSLRQIVSPLRAVSFVHSPSLGFIYGYPPPASLFRIPACSPRCRLRTPAPQPAPSPPLWIPSWINSTSTRILPSAFNTHPL